MSNKVAYLKGMLWFVFSATAMLSAFILPMHIWAVSLPFYNYKMRLDHPFFRFYFLVLFISALYHGLYRAKTILFDFGLGKYKKTIGATATIIFLIFAGLTVKLLFI